MAEHTPGPWGSIVGKSKTTVFDTRGQNLAQVYRIGKFNSLPDAANARLMAAAPKLLEALEKVEWIDDNDDLGLYCPWCGNYARSEHASDCVRQVAIEAARGTNDRNKASHQG